MKYVPNIVAGLLGLLFVLFGMIFLLNVKMEGPPMPEPATQFMMAVAPTGFMHFVKIFEVVGGLLVAVPKTRNIGLLVLGPILLNIVAFHVFQAKGTMLWNPPIVPVLCVMALYLLWDGRRAFAGLIR